MLTPFLQLNDLTARFNAGAVNAYEPQKIFKVKGTFVGHEGQVKSNFKLHVNQ